MLWAGLIHGMSFVDTQSLPHRRTLIHSSRTNTCLLLGQFKRPFQLQCPIPKQRMISFWNRKRRFDPHRSEDALSMRSGPLVALALALEHRLVNCFTEFITLEILLICL